MKIRTDFVTNSSSSSFVSYRITGGKLSEYIGRYFAPDESGNGFLEISSWWCDWAEFRGNLKIDEDTIELSASSKSNGCFIGGDILGLALEYCGQDTDYRNGDILSYSSNDYQLDNYDREITKDIVKALLDERPDDMDRAMSLLRDIFDNAEEFGCEFSVSFELC